MAARRAARRAKRSGERVGILALTVTIADALSFEGFKSFAADTVAVFVTAPDADGAVMMIVTVAKLPAAIDPSGQLTVVVPEHVP